VLGIIGLGVVILTGAVGIIAGFLLGAASTANGAATDLELLPFAVLACCMALGTVGFVLSIVATATGRGRGFGIAGIVGGVLAYLVIQLVGAVGTLLGTL